VTAVHLFIYDSLLRYSYNTCEVTNCCNNQFTTVSLWLFLYVRVKHVKVSAVKNKYYIKKHCSGRCRVYNNRCLIRLCIYFLYCTWRSSKVYFPIWQTRGLVCVDCCTYLAGDREQSICQSQSVCRRYTLQWLQCVPRITSTILNFWTCEKSSYVVDLSTEINLPSQSRSKQKNAHFYFWRNFNSLRRSPRLRPRPVFLNRRTAARYRALASVLPGRERFSWNS
jgi:hypothetical protein